MCMSSPKIPAPSPPPSSATPAEALKTINADQAAARDNSLRRMAARLSMERTNVTGGLGLANTATTTQKTLLGS
jgi:hypothetical protein